MEMHISWWRHNMEKLSVWLPFVRGIHRSPESFPIPWRHYICVAMFYCHMWPILLRDCRFYLWYPFSVEIHYIRPGKKDSIVAGYWIEQMCFDAGSDMHVNWGCVVLIHKILPCDWTARVVDSTTQFFHLLSCIVYTKSKKVWYSILSSWWCPLKRKCPW